MVGLLSEAGAGFLKELGRKRTMSMHIEVEVFWRLHSVATCFFMRCMSH